MHAFIILEATAKQCFVFGWFTIFLATRLQGTLFNKEGMSSGNELCSKVLKFLAIRSILQDNKHTTFPLLFTTQ